MDDLFPGEPLRYDQKCREWLGEFKAHAGESWFSPWLATTFADGTKMREGNPIFSGVRPHQARGFSIRQWQREEGDLAFDCYFDLLGEEGYFDPDGTPEQKIDLVICCCTEPEFENKAKTVLRDWMLWDTSTPLPKSLEPYAVGHDWEKWRNDRRKINNAHLHNPGRH